MRADFVEQVGGDSSVIVQTEEGAAVASPTGAVQWYEAAFRGRQLTGSALKIPPGAVGVVLEEAPPKVEKKRPLGKTAVAAGTATSSASAPAAASVNPDERQWTVAASFTSAMVWQRDASRAERQSLQGAALTWPSMARAVRSSP